MTHAGKSLNCPKSNSAAASFMHLNQEDNTGILDGAGKKHGGNWIKGQLIRLCAFFRVVTLLISKVHQTRCTETMDRICLRKR